MNGPVCQTCNGVGLIGGFVTPESGYQDEPCPDCQPTSEQILALASLVADAAKGHQDYALGNSQFKLNQLGYETLWEVAKVLRRVAKLDREAIIRECAAIAKAHKSSYRKKPNYKQFYKGASDEARLEIQAEERGEDIASEIIERTILALTSPDTAERRG